MLSPAPGSLCGCDARVTSHNLRGISLQFAAVKFWNPPHEAAEHRRRATNLSTGIPTVHAHLKRPCITIRALMTACAPLHTFNGSIAIIGTTPGRALFTGIRLLGNHMACGCSLTSPMHEIPRREHWDTRIRI